MSGLTRLAAVQLRTNRDRDGSLEETARLIERAVESGAGLIVLPELFSSPFVQPEPDPSFFAHAEKLDGVSNRMVQTASQRYGVTIVSSIFEAREVSGVYANTSCTFVAGELRHIYRKSHLPFSNGFPEKYYFHPGSEAPTAVSTTVGKVGTIICYERHFPELGRAVALDGGEVLAVPVACASAPMREVFELELRAQAVANGLYVVCANRSGPELAKEYFGASSIFGPGGEVLAVVEEGDGVAVADFDAGAVIAARTRRPFLRDRRPELYTSLVADS